MDQARRNLRPLKATLLALGWLLPAAVAAKAQSSCGLDFPHDSNPTEVSDEDVCNFHQVDESLFRGGRPRPSAFPKLVDLGVKTIISLEGSESAGQEKVLIDDLNGTLPPKQRIDFISFPIGPREMEQSGVSHEGMVRLFEQIRDARRPIFIHCYHGKDRTGAVVAVYRMRRHQKTSEEAYAEAFHYLFQESDLGLRRTIDRYEADKNLQKLPRLP
jgi:protein tyrosine/serine phosphatase